MKQVYLFVCALILAVSSANAFDLTDVADTLFKDKATGIEEQLRDAAFEFNVKSVILRNDKLRKDTHILVSRNRSSVLIAGEAKTQALKDKVLALVLDEARLQWTQGDVNNVEPSNAQACGEKASKMAANDRRRFNLKTAKECSTVNRFYNEVRVTEPRTELEQSDDDVRRAHIINQLLHASIIQSTDSIKVVVTDKQVYLLGDQLSKEAAAKATAFVKDLRGVEKVIPLFRF
jgi:osmotically-inducible protein OsmY